MIYLRMTHVSNGIICSLRNKNYGGSPSAAAAAAGRGESAMMKDVACCFFGVLWFGVRFETA
jgi:hypothetical protein